MPKSVTLFCICILLFAPGSCVDDEEQHKKDISNTADTITAPVIIKAGTPFISMLDTCPPPRIVAVPVKAGGHYTIKTSHGPKEINLAPPETTPAGFLATIHNYNTEQGLALNSINCGYKDEAGNLWFGTTGGGVSIYDGKSFTNLTTMNGLADNNILCIMQDKTGNFWFATDGSGVDKYDGQSFSDFTLAKEKSGNVVYSIIQDKNGNLWFGTGDGVSRYDGKSFSHFALSPDHAANVVSSIAEDKNGNIWFGTPAGAAKYDGRKFTNYSLAEGLAGNNVQSIFQDKNGNLWFGTDAGVSKYDSTGFTNYHSAQGLAGDLVQSIFQDKNENIWFGTDKGVSKYDGKLFTNLTVAQGLAGMVIHSITEDKTGNLWFGTDVGISKYDGESFTKFTSAQGLSGDHVFSITEDREGNLWFGGENSDGVSRYDGKLFTRFTTAQGLAANTVYSLYKDKAGDLWFGTKPGGVSKFDGKSFTSFNTSQGLAGNIVLSILQDKNGNFWFGTDGGGVSRYDGKSFTSFNSSQGLAGNTVWSITEDRNGNLWFGTDGKGISRYDGRSFINFTTAQGLAGNTIWSIKEDKNGNMLFGSENNGLSVLRKENSEKLSGDNKEIISANRNKRIFENYTTVEGLADNVIYGIAEDSNNNIIIGTNLGFTLLKGGLGKPGQLFAKDGIEYFNQKTGYPIKDLNINAVYIDSKGIIWGGGGDGLLRFEYSGVRKDSTAPVVFIQSIKINKEPVCWNDLRTTKEKPGNSATAPNITEEVFTFGKILTEQERDTLRQKFSVIQFDSISRFYPVPQNLVLPYKNNDIIFDFMTVETGRNFLVRYQYILEGYDNDWSPVTDKTTANFSNISAGTYTFKVKAQSPDGVWSKPVTYTFKVLSPWYRSWWMYVVYALSFFAALRFFVKLRERGLIREKEMLEKKITLRTNQLSQEKEKAEVSFSELKSAQAQLIQSEKMASLGELTAGIAHEIQNPLNFVNNFAEVNSELIKEMKQEIDKGNSEEVKSIADNIDENEQKIIYHGRHADAIVKSMLQHSRKNAGEKAPTNINTLSDEYLRLAYHGLRAKDKDFHATMKTDYDESIGKINIIPQDIGRVLLNLYNNAFYAVTEKKKHQPEVYEPTVSIKTKCIRSPSPDGGKIDISISDNGNGIPQDIVDKIFQPFFTTKPAGSGTGLGLSLSYDIIKAHGGEIKMETKEGEGTEFIIQLPVSN